MRSILLIVLYLALGGNSWAKESDHGSLVLAEFSRERPAAAAILQDIPEVTDFLLRAFQGSYTSVPLIWDNAEPQGNAYAENTPNDEGTFIIVRVSEKLLTPVDQLAALVYECRNAQNEKLFAQQIRDAYLGKLAKEEFVHGILRLEHNKMKETRAFLTPIDFFKQLDSAKTDFYRKMLGTPEGFDEFLEYLHQIKRPEYDVFDMYRKFYDYLTVTPQKRKEEMDRVREAAVVKKEEEADASQAGDQPVLPQENKNMSASP